MKRPDPSLHRLSRTRLRLVHLLAKILLTLEWLEKLAEPTRINIPKIGISYFLSLGATLTLFAPPVVRIPDIIILWALSWLLTLGVYQFLPGR